MSTNQYKSRVEWLVLFVLFSSTSSLISGSTTDLYMYYKTIHSGVETASSVPSSTFWRGDSTPGIDNHCNDPPLYPPTCGNDHKVDDNDYAVNIQAFNGGERPLAREELGEPFPSRYSAVDTPDFGSYANMHRRTDKSIDGSYKHAKEKRFANCTNLIIVPGHARYMGNDRESNLKYFDVKSSNSTIPGSRGNLQFVDDWVLEPYQISQLDHFKRHIEVGIEHVSKDNRSILLFSGGQTREDAGPVSEASGYYMYALQNGLFNISRGIRERIFTEDYARDSLENLLFSICRFKQLTDYYPEHITVIGFPFKAWRFAQLHRAAMYFPSSRFTYESVTVGDNDITTETVEIRPHGWENNSNPSLNYDTAIEDFQKDRYGCSEKLYKKKEDERNPFYNINPYPLYCPELLPFFHCC